MSLRRTRASLGILSSVALVSTILAPAAGAADEPDVVVSDDVGATEEDKERQTYVVVLADAPVATYDGDVPGYPATREKNPNSAQVRKYEKFLERQADEVLRSNDIETSAKEEQFTAGVSAIAADLNEAEAAKLRADDRVLAVSRNEIHELTTNSTPEFLGLTSNRGRDKGLWTQGIKGEDVVIGVIDSGIRPENPSFADTGYDTLDGWTGGCDAGLDGSFTGCNDKLVTARYYFEGYFGAGATVEDVKAEFPLEFVSPLDADGHGTHTAGTAGGNEGVATPFGEIAGIAPRARIAAYKACWGYAGEGGCATLDTVAAIDQAVADGVDVINYSISGTADNYLSAVEVAFLFAADAGVVVNASAGNNGPGLSTANHPSPWINTVAAGTEDAAFAGEVTLGNGDVYGGRPSIGNPGTEQLPLVFAGDIAADGVDPADAALCFADTLDPALAEGNMVLCNRGVIARTAKSDEVARAGGAAMILANVDDNSSLNSDAHVIPTIHVDNTVRQAIAVYLESADAPTAALSAARVDTIVAPDPAGFSSRGPIGSRDVLKPDILAPGVDILAAYSPTVGGRDFDFLSGTSMSSPHAAGHSALLKELYPAWSSAAIQSAMMTTAYQTRTDGSPISGGPFAWGSGHIDPNASANPGLVYDAGFFDYLDFLAGTGFIGGPAIDPSDLNEPNIAVGELAFQQTVTRTVTNVSGKKGNWTVSVDAPPGVDVDVSPSRLQLAAGESASYEVTFTTRADATLGEFAFGSLTWSAKGRDVRSTLVVRPVELAVVDEVSGAGVDGSTTYDITFGYEGEFTAAAHGMVAATEITDTVADDPTNDILTALETGEGIEYYDIEVPAGTAYTRFALFNEYTSYPGDDLDLYVFGPNADPGNLLASFAGQSGNPESNEQIDLAFPEAGTYTVAVHGWQVGTADQPSTDFTLFAWNVAADPADDDGSLAVTDAPASATIGETGSITAEWSGLAPGTKHLGAVSYANADGLIGLTLVAVDTD